MSLTFALANHWVENPSVAALVGSTEDVPWIWRGRPFEALEGTGQAAVIIRSETPDLPPGPWSKARRNIINIEVLYDPPRDPAGSAILTDEEVTEAARLLWESVTGTVVKPGTQLWDSLYVSSVVIDRMPSVMQVPSGSGLVSCTGRLSLWV